MKHSRVDVRRAHPGMYHAIMTFAGIQVLLALNFWFGPPPTFVPKVIVFTPSMNLIATIFFALGTLQLVFLNVLRDLRKVRFVMSLSVGWAFAWGGVNTQQVIAGKASWQIPILFLGLCVSQVWWLIESPVNPMTRRK